MIKVDIIAQQYLYIRGRIPHRDISSNDIIITKSNNESDYKGMLISTWLKSGTVIPGGARNQTGIMQFMAIEVLRGTDHIIATTWRLFFYVLLWMCVRCAWDNKKNIRRGDEVAPNESDLRNWEIGSFKDIAKTKEGDMTVNGLERIMGEFSAALEVVRPLCLRIRRRFRWMQTSG